MKWVILVMKYLPLVLQAVKAVEKEIGPGNGKTKKQAILAAIQAGAQVGQHVDIEELQAVAAIIDGVVDVFNKSGVFDSRPRTEATQ